MIKKCAFLLSFIFLSIITIGQVVVRGKITDAETGKPIEKASVQVQNTHFGTSTAQNGNYLLRLPYRKNYTLVFSHLNYKVKYKSVSVSENNDTVVVNIELFPKINELNPVEISAQSEPVTVFKSTKINVADFQFYEDKFLMVTYPKTLNKNSEIVLTDQNEHIIDKHFIPGKPTELYTNYVGQVFLICENKAYFVNILHDAIFLEPFKKEDIDLYVKPIVDKVNHHIIFSDFIRQYPNFKYYLFNKNSLS